MDRRLFMGGAIGALAGCYSPPPGTELRHMLDLGVDAHVHLFNGRDVPVTGFLRQVVFSEHGFLPLATPLASLVELVVQIMRAGTPTARQEMAGIAPRNLADDQKSVAQGIDAFRNRMSSQRSLARADTGGQIRDDALLLDLLARDAMGEDLASTARVMQRAAPASDMTTSGMTAPEMTGEELAALIYRAPGVTARQVTRQAASLQRAAPSSGALVATIQWAGLLTRGRKDLMNEMLRLYRGKGEGQIQVFVASLLDLEYWLDSAAADHAALSPLDDQIELMSRLVHARKDVLVLNFAPFCPLRAAVEGPKTLQRVKDAVLRQGFAGVKLYPPMGFRATCNDGISFAHTQRPNGVTGRDIDQALEGLYAWCAAEDVPIQAHANNSMAAAKGTGLYASPVYWERVLEMHPNLRVNLSHAGHVVGNEPLGATVCGIKPEGDWLAVIARMIGKGQQVWFDTGHWTEVALSSGDRAAAIGRLHQLADTHAPEEFPRHMLYGSDWTMIARLPGFNAYHQGMQDFIYQLYADNSRRQAVMGGNALGFLLGKTGGRQYRRLARFYADNEVWKRFPA